MELFYLNQNGKITCDNLFRQNKFLSLVKYFVKLFIDHVCIAYYSVYLYFIHKQKIYECITIHYCFIYVHVYIYFLKINHNIAVFMSETNTINDIYSLSISTKKGGIIIIMIK